MATLQQARQRLESAGVTAGDRYQEGASGKGSKWLTRTSAAGANFQEGIQRALAAKSFDKGVAAAGASSYDEGVRNRAWTLDRQGTGRDFGRRDRR